jgi:hypothetical protein
MKVYFRIQSPTSTAIDLAILIDPHGDRAMMPATVRQFLTGPRRELSAARSAWRPTSPRKVRISKQDNDHVHARGGGTQLAFHRSNESDTWRASRAFLGGASA